MNERKENRQFDFSFYVSKYVIPLLERKWIVLLCLFLAILLVILISSFTRPEYISQATLLIEEPRSEISKIKQDSVAPRRAEMSYVVAEEEKLKSSSFAAEVLKILPDRAKDDLETRLDLFFQIIKGVKARFGIKSGRVSQLMKRRELLIEIRNRVNIRSKPRSALIWITASAFDQEMAPVIAQSYIDVCLAANIEENKKVISAERKFAEEQKGQAYQRFQDAEQEMINFKRHYEIPGDFEVARDVEIQLQLERLNSRLSMDKDRFDYLNKIYFNNQMKEAGIVGNIRVIDPPAFPANPSRKAEIRLVFVIVMGGLMLGIFVVLLLDYIKGSIRHETDIIDTVHLPVLGHIPKISK